MSNESIAQSVSNELVDSMVTGLILSTNGPREAYAALIASIIQIYRMNCKQEGHKFSLDEIADEVSGSIRTYNLANFEGLRQ